MLFVLLAVGLGTSRYPRSSDGDCPDGDKAAQFKGGLGGHIIPTLSGCYLGVGKNKPVSILPTGVLEVRFSRFSQFDDLQVIIRGTQTGKGILTENLGVTLSEMPDIGHPV